jgi:hypothetical protein
MDKLIVEAVLIGFQGDDKENILFKSFSGWKPGKHLSDSVSKIFKAANKPWKVGEIRGLPSWKKIQSSSNEDVLINFKNFCDENDIYCCIIQFGRMIKIGPDYALYSDSVRSQVKLKEIGLPEDVGGDKGIFISNLKLNDMPEGVVRSALLGNPVSFSILELTQENVDKMQVIASIKQEATKAANSEADFIAQKEQEKQKSDQRMANAGFNGVLIAIAGFICFFIFGFAMILKSISDMPSASYEGSGGSMTINGESYTRQQFEDKLRSEAETLYDNCQVFGRSFSDKCP